jgi:hypothetical protein
MITDGGSDSEEPGETGVMYELQRHMTNQFIYNYGYITKL